MKRTPKPVPPSAECCCCKVESIVALDERGQMVLPKELRERLALGAGEKLALLSWGQGPQACLVLMKMDRLSGMLAEMLGPLAQGLAGAK